MADDPNEKYIDRNSIRVIHRVDGRVEISSRLLAREGGEFFILGGHLFRCYADEYGEVTLEVPDLS